VTPTIGETKTLCASFREPSVMAWESETVSVGISRKRPPICNFTIGLHVEAFFQAIATLQFIVAGRRDHGGVVCAKRTIGKINLKPFFPRGLLKRLAKPAVRRHTAADDNGMQLMLFRCLDRFFDKHINNRFLKRSRKIFDFWTFL